MELEALIRRVKRDVLEATGYELREEVWRVPHRLDPAVSAAPSVGGDGGGGGGGRNDAGIGAKRTDSRGGVNPR